MSVGVLRTPKLRGARMTMFNWNTNDVVAAVGGVLNPLTLLAYDTVVYDSDGFTTGHGLADGLFVVPPGMGGVYRLEGVSSLFPPGNGAASATVGYSLNPANDYSWSTTRFYDESASAYELPHPTIEVVLAEGTLVGLMLIHNIGPVGNSTVVAGHFSIEYLGPA